MSGSSSEDEGMTVICILAAMAAIAIWGSDNGSPPDTDDPQEFLAEAPDRLGNFAKACGMFVVLLILVAML